MIVIHDLDIACRPFNNLVTTADSDGNILHTNLSKRAETRIVLFITGPIPTAVVHNSYMTAGLQGLRLLSRGEDKTADVEFVRYVSSSTLLSFARNLAVELTYVARQTCEPRVGPITVAAAWRDIGI